MHKETLENYSNYWRVLTIREGDGADEIRGDG